MWQLKIQDPSGETRAFNIPNPTRTPTYLTLGRHDSNAEILLRDSTLPIKIGTLKMEAKTPFWLTLDENTPSALIADMRVRNAQILPQIPWRLGESRLTIEPISPEHDLPSIPTHTQAWKTQSPPGKEILWMTKKSANTRLAVYLKGETGTGKELLAHLIHSWSDRAAGPFIPINCGALPSTLVESELFGHAKGAFTGAFQNRAGALLQAHNGTLFLDEVGDLSSETQSRLLRFLENGEIRPLGSDRILHANVRLICATHKCLEEMVKAGTFRQDLYFRLASITISIPPLRERPLDIALLAREFAQEYGKSISYSAIMKLKTHHWPGNVRELRHAIERASGLARPWSTLLTEEDFEFLFPSLNKIIETKAAFSIGMISLYEMERLLVIRALHLCQGNRTQAALLLGISRSGLFDKIKRHGIPGPRSYQPIPTTRLRGSKNKPRELFHDEPRTEVPPPIAPEYSAYPLSSENHQVRHQTRLPEYDLWPAEDGLSETGR